MKRREYIRAVRALAAEHGAVVELTRGGHLQVRHPTHGWVVTTARTPSDWRAFLNFRSDVRRAARSVRPSADRATGPW